MDIAVDTNVLVADPWLSGQKMKALFNFLERTRSHLLVHEVVDQEFRAVVSRNLASAAAELEAATRNATRAGLDPPTVTAAVLTSGARDRWERRYHETAWARTHIALDNNLLPEVLRRATNRIPPSARKGEEFRDTIMWLGVLAHCRANALSGIAFISANKKDFCGTDERTLAPELVADAAAQGLVVQYYVSLDDFLREHATPLERFTDEWVLERFSIPELERRIESRISEVEAAEFQLPYRYDGWRPFGYVENLIATAHLNDVYVWAYSATEVTLFLTFYVHIVADATCYRESPGEWGEPVEVADVPVEAEYEIEVSASIQADELVMNDIETMERV